MTSTFEAGKTYRLWCYIKPASGYIIYGQATATLNGNSVTPSSVDADGIYFTYTLELPKISTVNVTLTEPVAGAKPDTAISASTEGVAVSATRIATSADTCRWYHGSDLMTDTDSFIGGETYTARFMIRAKTGYEFSGTPTVYVNGKAATYKSTTGTSLTYEISYTLPTLGILKTVNITVTEPKAGEAMNTAALADKVITLSRRMRVGSSNIEVPNLVSWSDGSALMSDGSVFEEGKTYTVMARIKANDGYQLAPSTRVLINGKAATTTATDFSGYVSYIAEFTAASAALIGDVDGNGSISMKDLTTLQRYINGWPVTIVEANSDVNGDGSISMKDLTSLQRLINTL